MLHSGKPKLYQVLVRWFMLAGLICTALSLVLYSLFSYQTLKNYAFLNLTSSCEQQAQLIDRWFLEKEGDLKQLSLSPLVKGKSVASVAAVLDSYLTGENTGFDALFFAETDGTVVTNTGNNGLPVAVKDTEYFKRALAGKDSVSAIVENRIEGRPVVVAASPVFSDDRVIGVVCGIASLHQLDRLISSFYSGDTGESYLVDERGFMITVPRFSHALREEGIISASGGYGLIAHLPAISAVTSGANGCMEHLNYRGASVFAAYRWLPERGWGLVVEMEKAEIMGPWYNKLFISIVILLSLMLMVAYPLSRHFADKMVTPLSKTALKVSAFAENYKTDPISWAVLDDPVYAEIDVLSQSFYRMGEKISHLMHSLESQAQYDHLTGLANRYYFYKRGQQILDLIQRNERVCSLIFLDIDKFKKINDTYGHNVGDEVLIHLGEILENNIRVSDVVGRIGGEEFAIILPDTDIPGAMLLAERLRCKVEETPLLVGSKKLALTVSMGVASYRGTKVKADIILILEELIKQADAAMYKAKQKGRNRIEIYKHS